MFNFGRENTGLVAKWWRNIDKQILFSIIFLFLLGLFFSFSSTSQLVGEKLNKETLEPIINNLIKSNETNFKGVGQPLRIVLISTPIGFLGSGKGGGVELTLLSITKGLLEMGHQVVLVAPEGSTLPLDFNGRVQIINIKGKEITLEVLY